MRWIFFWAFFFLSPAQRRGMGRTLWRHPGRPAIRLSVRIFVSGAYLENPWGFFSYCSYTHHLGGVGVPFGGYHHVHL